MDVKSDPDVYFTFNKFFHKGNQSSSGTTVNGRIRRASGPNLETVVDVITGLPTSDLDHGLNGIEFGDGGELYFTSGSHTNGGIPGPLSSSRILKENFLSAGVNVAYMSHPAFNGSIAWSAPDDGNMIATGIDVFAMGLRNPFSLVLHSNGKLYGTDNGPNLSYGPMATGCGPTDFVGDAKRDDELVWIQKGHYYGHPNFKRATFFNNPTQCVWIPPEIASTANYTAPLMTHLSSTDGIMEFHGNHFGGQLRGDLFMIRYNGANNIIRVILTPDGTQLLPSLNKKPLQTGIGSQGLDLTQAPNGNLIEMRYQNETVYFHKPLESPTTALIAKICFPRRGPNAGGNRLTVYGVNFNVNSPTVTVTVGGVDCPVTSVSATRIDCTLPGGSGTVDIVVNNGPFSSTFQKGYRYISGIMPMDFVMPVYSG
jgi:glucose/arabinose dehydrogenase